jgi:co-chaperonin GroES (HSP10)
MVKAYGERLLAQRLTFNDGVTREDSGLFVYRDEKKHYDDAMVLHVVSVGPRVVHDVSEGDQIITRGMAGADVKFGGEQYISLHQDDLLAVVDTGG